MFLRNKLIDELPERRHYLVNVDGHARAWMKHPKVESIGIHNPADKSDKAWITKGYKPWEYSQSVNLPLFESQVDGMLADSPYSYRIFLEKAQIFLQNAGFSCKLIETRWKILRYIQSDVAYVGPRPILS